MEIPSKGDVECLEVVSENSSSSQASGSTPTRQILSGFDLTNSRAFKGDDSDGGVVWSSNQILAAIFLSMLSAVSQAPGFFTGSSENYIGAALNASDSASWLSAVQNLTLTAVCPFAGYLMDTFGKRYTTLAGAALICIGSAVFGSAQHIVQACVGIGIVGAGSGIGQISGVAGIVEIVPVNKRGVAVAISSIFVAPWAGYPFYTAFFSTRGPSPSWRWGGWILLGYSLITLVGLFFVYFPRTHVRAEGMRVGGALKQLDYVGGALSMAGLVLVMIGLQSGGNTHSWSSGYVLSLLIVGFAVIAAWLSWEWKVAKHPMIPKEVFGEKRLMSLCLVIALFSGFSFATILRFWPVAAAVVWGSGGLKVARRITGSAYTFGMGGATANAMLSDFPHHARFVFLAFASLIAAFIGGLESIDPFNASTAVALATIGGVGVGGIYFGIITLGQIATPDALLSTSTGLMICLRSFGNAVGYAIYDYTFSKRAGTYLPALVAEYALKAGLPQSSTEQFVGTFLSEPSQASSVPGATAEVITAAYIGQAWAYAKSLQPAWWVSMSIGICAMVCAIGIPSTRRLQTNRIAVAL